MPKVLRIHPSDNVAVALEPIEPGAEVAFNGQRVQAKQPVPPGHKIALGAIRAGADICKYGWPIGRATAAIEPGAWVHTHNVSTKLEGLLDYRYQPALAPRPDYGPEPKFLGYRRPDGRVGIRNELWIVVTVGCVNNAAQTLARLGTERLVKGSVEGVYAFPHPYGCSQLGDDLMNTQKALAGLIRHPNCGGVLVLGLGCENNAVRRQIEAVGPVDSHRVKFFNAQEVSDEVEEGMKALEELAEYAGGFERAECPASDLVLGMKCGGSDGFSGITANPVVGVVSDMVTSWGGTVLLTEVPEMFGAEQILMNRATDEHVFNATVEMINGFKEYFIRHNQPIYENPAPGNKEGGITTLEEKSLGCILKGGCAPVTQVLGYGEPVTRKGLVLVTAPGNDGVSTTAMVMSGAAMLLFTTGRGTPLGTPAPTLKLSTNTPLAQRKPNWIDFDAGRLLSEGADMPALGRELMQMVLDTASGRYRARNEVNGMRDIAIFKTGVTV